MTILNQRDPQWRDIKLGYSSTSTLGAYGCTVTCLAMLAGITPVEVNERLKRVQGFKDDLIIWAKIKEAIPWLEFEWRGYEYDNERVKKAIEDNGACLVEVDFDGKISSPRDSHWVLFRGNGRMYDPWTGVEKSTSYYPITKGYAVIKVKQPEPPVNEVLPVIVDLGDLGKMEPQAIISTIKDLRRDNETLTKQNAGLWKEKKAWTDKWAVKFGMSGEVGLQEIEKEMENGILAHDTAQKLRDAIERLAGKYETDEALLLALSAVKDDKETLKVERDDCLRKLAGVPLLDLKELISIERFRLVLKLYLKER